MRKGKWIGGLIAVLLTSFLLWRFAPNRQAPQRGPQSDFDKPDYASPHQTTSALSHNEPGKKQLPGGPYESSDPRWNEMRLKDRLNPGWEWKIPLSFYGKAVDENNKPVAQAEVFYSWTNLSTEGSSQERTLSDANGLFSLSGKMGKFLEVRVRKDGYHTAKEDSRGFEYADFSDARYYEPDPANPVLFRLRKRHGVEGLITGETVPPLPADGTRVRLDLLEDGGISSGGQLEISATTNTEDYPPRIFDWSGTIAISNGGLVEQNVEFPFQAPEDGYQPSVEFKMWANAPEWRHSVEKNYFIRFGSPPIYGRIRVRFGGATQSASVSYAINPTGSRDLEEKEKPKSVPPP